MFREPRIVTRCRVQYTRLDQTVVAESEDLSATGVFVRTETLLPVGAVVKLQIELPNGRRFKVVSRVAHLLSKRAARALGRKPGMGFAFLEHDQEGRHQLSTYLEELADQFTPTSIPVMDVCRVVIADTSMPMIDRVANALTNHGFQIKTAGHGGEAFAECQDWGPDILLTEIDLPVMDGWVLLKQLSNHSDTAGISVVLMSEDSSDMTRLQAYRAGVADFVPKPFTDEELCIRLRRVALDTQSRQRRVLRGELENISLATLLSLLSFENKSGILILVSADDRARIFVAEGRVVRVEGGPTHDGFSARRRLLALLDWPAGSFEFSGCEVVGTDEVGLRTDQLLLEHARIRDEQQFDKSPKS